jgi:hypothetical protein
MMSFLNKEERETLSKAYPRFQIKKPNKPQGKADTQQKEENSLQTVKEEIKTQDVQAEETTGNIEKEEDDDDDDEHAEETVEKETKPQDVQVAEATCTKEDVKDKETTNDHKHKPGATATSGPSVSDPHTLLARLNAKRLYRRIRHQQKQNKDFDFKDAYPFNKTSEQIAIHEWQSLLVQFKKSCQKENEEQEERSKLPSPIPSSCELLLFSPCPRAVAVLASYPRSGNSLLRTLYEKTTLRVTGSDMRGGLTKHDLVGEMATQANTVQFVKTHYPERRGYPPFGVSRAVLLVRNPYDAMESYFNLMMTNSHTTSVSEEQRKKHAKVFEEMAMKEIQVWRDFHEYWLAQKIPLLVIRYEDLIRYTDKVIAKVIRFVLEINDMRFFEERIGRCIREEQIERLGSYKPRSGGIGKSLSKYSPELLQQINVGILSTMEKFGYSEMLVPNPSEWKLEPLDQYGVKIPGAPKTPPLAINGKGLVRGPKRHTNWMAVKKQMNMDKEDTKCTCPKCMRGR